MHLFDIFMILAGISVLAALLFWGLASRQKRLGEQRSGPSYPLFAWLAVVVAVFFVLMMVATFEIRIM